MENYLVTCEDEVEEELTEKKVFFLVLFKNYRQQKIHPAGQHGRQHTSDCSKLEKKLYALKHQEKQTSNINGLVKNEISVMILQMIAVS
jgi:hypothetical protein